MLPNWILAGALNYPLPLSVTLTLLVDNPIRRVVPYDVSCLGYIHETPYTRRRVSTLGMQLRTTPAEGERFEVYHISEVKLLMEETHMLCTPRQWMAIVWVTNYIFGHATAIDIFSCHTWY